MYVRVSAGTLSFCTHRKRPSRLQLLHKGVLRDAALLETKIAERRARGEEV